MNILIDPGTRNCRNMGDVAMLQVAIARLRTVFPGATIRVFTDDSAALGRHCPGVEPVPGRGRALWLGAGALTRALDGRLPTGARRRLDGYRRQARLRWPTVQRKLCRLRTAFRAADRIAMQAFDAALGRTELLVWCGQATLADDARVQAFEMLETAALALRRGTGVALLGQAVGPLRQADLAAHAGGVLRWARLVAVREQRESVPLLLSLGVPDERIVFTGDDAIELAYDARTVTPGTAIGVHMRVAPLAAPGLDVLRALAPVLRDAARARGVPLVPLPVSHHPKGAYDPRAISEVAGELDPTGDGGANWNTPIDVICAAGRCRVVVTGAYHAAIFALAQGVPVVCLGQSPYYLMKFAGLHDAFGDGVRVVRLDAPELPVTFSRALEESWATADAVREPLLRAAARQTALGRSAYLRLAALPAEGALRADPTVAATGTASETPP